MASVLSVGFGAPLCSGAGVTISKSGANWTITNGGTGSSALTIVFSTSGEEITSISLNGSPDLLNPGGGTDGSLDAEFSGTPFGAGTQTANDVIGASNSYVDVWTAVNSTNSTVNPFTYAFHYVVFANNPTIMVYETVTAPASESGGTESLGQGQFLFRSNTNYFTNLFQSDTGPNNLNTVTTTGIPSTNSKFGTVVGTAGRTVSNVTYDLTGSGITGDNGTNFFTKYDYSTYTQFEQAETMYGSTYAVSEVIPSTESLTGGPTKQELAWTDPGILNLEFLSDHYGIDGNGSIGNSTTAAYPGYAWYPTSGGESKLFGAYAFYIQDVGSQSASTLNQNAINEIPSFLSDESSDTELVSSGYVASNARGTVQLNASSTVGWSSNTDNNTAVLSEPHVNMQESTQGYQYWGQVSSSGALTFANVAPGNYRLTLYQLGQWGETRIDGVTVSAGQINTPKNVTFTAENFNSTATPVWTIGTPNRSDNEFLNGSNTSVTFTNHNAVAVGKINSNAAETNDERQFYGAYNYWWQEEQLGTDGYINYNATNTTINGTAVSATNNTLDWPNVMWGEFDPGIYDSANNTSGGYVAGYGVDGGEPSYVASGGGAATYRGSPWTVNFAVTQTQENQGQYIDLSVALGALNASLVVTLNGHSETWSYNNFSPDDPAGRSGDAGFYQWGVFEFPTTDLNAVGANNEFTFGVSNHTYGVMWDALRMEIDNRGANPSTTGWYDYTYINESGVNTAPIDYNGLTATNSLALEEGLADALAAPSVTAVPEPSGPLLAIGAAGLLLLPRRRRRLPTG
jgi:rhamnogalacturonan endolyase